MFCTSCGAQIKDGLRFCTECGAPLKQEADAPAEKDASGVPDAVPDAPGAADATTRLDTSGYAVPPTVRMPVADAPAFCTECGKPLETGSAFCTFCGAKADGPAIDPGPVPDMACPYCGALQWPGSAFCTECGKPLHGGVRTDDGADGRSDAKGGSKSKRAIVIAVAAIALVAALVAAGLFVAPRLLASSAEEEEEEEEVEEEAVELAMTTTTEDADAAAEDDAGEVIEEEVVVEDTGLSETEIYEVLEAAYDAIAAYNSLVAEVATNFNTYYLDSSLSTRSAYAAAAAEVQEAIALAKASVDAYDIPTTSVNYSAWEDIKTLYYYLQERIDVICEAWEISLSYDDPSAHASEITAPLAAEIDSSSGSNKYYVAFNELYPTVTLVTP